MNFFFKRDQYFGQEIYFILQSTTNSQALNSGATFENWNLDARIKADIVDRQLLFLHQVDYSKSINKDLRLSSLNFQKEFFVFPIWRVKSGEYCSYYLRLQKLSKKNLSLWQNSCKHVWFTQGWTIVIWQLLLDCVFFSIFFCVDYLIRIFEVTIRFSFKRQ